MLFVSFLIFQHMADLDMYHKNHLSILRFDNHFQANSSYLLVQKREAKRPLVSSPHHSVTFYFTVLSEPSQDSSLGHFLFYRPVRTVTGLIFDEGGTTFLEYIICHTYQIINTLLKFFSTS